MSIPVIYLPSHIYHVVESVKLLHSLTALTGAILFCMCAFNTIALKRNQAKEINESTFVHNLWTPNMGHEEGQGLSN